MNWTDDLLVRLVRDMVRHHVFDPAVRTSTKGSVESPWASIVMEEPWCSFKALGNGQNSRPLYHKGTEVVRDYRRAIDSEKYHTGTPSEYINLVSNCPRVCVKSLLSKALFGTKEQREPLRMQTAHKA